MYNIVIPVIMVFIYLIFLEKNKINEQFQNTNDNTGKTNSQKSDITFTVELVELNPIFSDKKFVIKDEINDDGSITKGVLTQVENTDWKEDFTKKLCQGCSCFNPKVYYGKRDPVPSMSSSSPSPSNTPSPSHTPSPSPSNTPSPSYTPTPSPSRTPSVETFSNLSPSSSGESSKTVNYEEIISGYEDSFVMEKRRNCGFRLDGNEYQCAQVCPQCNLCHKDESNIQNKYLDKCNLPMEAEDEELCKFYRDRVKFVKDTCVFPSELNKVIVNDRECFSFYDRNNNRYFTNDKIIFRLKTNKDVDLIDIFQIFYRTGRNKKIKINPIMFYSNKNELYFFINTKNLPNFNGDVKINVKLNITYKGKKDRYENYLYINIRKPLEYIKMYENVPIKKKKDVKKDDTLPADFDLYNLNYLEESELNPKQIVSGYSTRNKVEDYEIGEFKRLEYKDNPETWKLRPDINRPWISVG